MAHRFPEDAKARLRDERRRQVQPAEELVARMAPRAEERVADLGSGTGYVTVPLARRVRMVVAVDAQRGMLETLRELAPGADNIVPVVAAVPPIPLADASMDRVVLVNVLHEVEPKDVLAKEVRRVLRPGGRLSIVDFPRRETSFGPPVEERIEPDEAAALFPSFTTKGRWELSEYYQLELEKLEK